MFRRQTCDTFIFAIVDWNNNCYSKNLFTRLDTIVVCAKLFFN